MLPAQDTTPPKDTFVNVRGLKDVGEVTTTFGRATILYGTTLSLPVEEAEPLLRDGTVEQVRAEKWRGWDKIRNCMEGSDVRRMQAGPKRCVAAFLAGGLG